MTKKHLWEIALFVLIAAVFVGAGAKMFLVGKAKVVSENNQVQSEVEKNSDISGWQTYINETYGFEIKYPSTWYMSEGFTTGNIFTLYDRKVGPGLPAVSKTIQFQPYGDTKTSVWKRYENETIEAYAKRFAEYNKGPGKLLETSGGYLSGNQSGYYQVSTKTIDTDPVWGCESQPCPAPPQKNIEYRQVTTYIPIPLGNSIFIVTARIQGGQNGNPKIDEKEEKEYLEKYQQILSEFRFTNAFYTEGWQTYKNNEYSFSIKYPPTWSVEQRTISSGVGKGLVVFDIYQKSSVLDKNKTTRVTIAPQGDGVTERLFPGKTSTLILPNQSKAFDFYLKNNDIWGMFFKFKNIPDSWSDKHVVLYDAYVANKNLYCEENGIKVDNSLCGYDSPGHYVMEGEVNPLDIEIARYILESFAFFDSGILTNNKYGFAFTYSNSRVDNPCGLTGSLVEYCVRFTDKEDNTATIIISPTADLLKSGWFSEAKIINTSSKIVNKINWTAIEAETYKKFSSETSIKHVWFTTKNSKTYIIQGTENSAFLESALKSFTFTQ